MIVMAGKTSGDSSRRVPGIIFRKIQDSFTTQGLASKASSGTDSPATGRPKVRQPRPAEIEVGTDLRIFINTRQSAHRRYDVTM
jgi:hypothetical protein